MLGWITGHWANSHQQKIRERNTYTPISGNEGQT